MRGYEPWPGRAPRAVPLETARELVRQVEAARGTAEDALQQAARARSEAEAARVRLQATREELARRQAEVQAETQAAAEARGEAERLRRELDLARAELEATRAAAPRPDGRVEALLADLANVRRQRDAEIDRARAAERVAGVARLGEVLDDLARAVAAQPDRSSAWYQGHVAILGRVRSLLRQAGAREVGCAGEPFDPHLHEAVGTAAGPPGAVIRVERVGLQLDDGTLVRPALVTVAAHALPTPEETP